MSDDSSPPMVNTPQLARRLRVAWSESMGDERVVDIPTQSMVAEDFPYFTIDPDIPTVYWGVGGTPQEDFDRAAAGGPPVPSHHSPLFKITPRPAVTLGTEATVVALLDLLQKQ